MQATLHFQRKIKGGNIMTPEVLEYGWIEEGEVSYELSRGTGFLSHDELIGVTLAGSPHGTDKNACFSEMGAARDYIAELKGEK